MAYSTATMVGDPRVARDRNEMVISWESSDPAGTWFQVYLDRRLALWTQARKARFPWPRQLVHIDVGTVLPAEVGDDFSAAIAAATPIPLDKVRLDWQGGTFEGADLAGYFVFQSLPGAAVVLTNPVATIPRTVAGVDLSGWGVGGWGAGGWGSAAAEYTWTSGRLRSGVYTFAIAAFDTAGNLETSPATITATIAVPPLSPAAFADGRRLRYTLSVTNQPILTWNASPP